MNDWNAQFIDVEDFGYLSDGRRIEIYTLRNTLGSEARIMTYGGVLVSLRVPDRYGDFADVVFGHDSLADYEQHRVFFGATIGRFGNRIAKGRFTLDGREYALATNNGENHLHGGRVGFDRVVWAARPYASPEGGKLELNYTSPDGDEGYPGTLEATVTYALTEHNELTIEYEATCDAPTIVNLTNHTYFNLTGSTGTILDHELRIDASAFTPVDATQIPTGEIRELRTTAFDFTEPLRIGSRIGDEEEQLRFGFGYDHNWVLDKGIGFGPAAEVFEPVSGRVMEIFTTEPGLQFYSGNFLDGSLIGKKGIPYEYRTAFCLETQHFPDSPNHPNFPSTVLRPGEVYRQKTIYRFSTRHTLETA
jgi:aldose 1-epimerase